MKVTVNIKYNIKSNRSRSTNPVIVVFLDRKKLQNN
jgi:hypothetical protein